MNKRKLGTFYEAAACEYLMQHGVTILHRNYRCRLGEVDIIGSQNGCVVFFEVKYRRTDQYGNALFAVDDKKQERICRCASVYCMQHPNVTQIRYDVIGITDTRIQWIQNAFSHKGYRFY